jgi:hypothetical protein
MWSDARAKNSREALGESFTAGFGLETDVRDSLERLVISHDIPPASAIPFEEFLSFPGRAGLPLALNVKADGLADLLRTSLEAAGALDDAFVFDMSVPDTRAYFDAGIPVFTRMSEVERSPVWLDRSAGVWLDSFGPEWYSADLVRGLLDSGKKVCVVSSELHGRRKDVLWESLLEFASHPALLICTDLPLEASDYFGGTP